MRRTLFSLVSILLVALAAFARAQDFSISSLDGTPTADEINFMSNWKALYLDKSADDSPRYSHEIPFSFLCGERSSREWTSVADADVELGEWQGGVRRSTLTWRDSVSSLECRLLLDEYEKFPAIQYTVVVRNVGTENSGRISHFNALDLRWNRADGSLPILYRSQGADSRNDDFLFQGEDMRKSMWTHQRDVRIDSASNSAFRKALNSSLFDSDDRPSATWLPFFNYKTGPDGLLVGLGWNGGWFAEFNHDGDGRTAMTAGQERLDAFLYPGEAIRSPLVMLMYWRGEVGHAQNMFRRFILAHNHPQIDGKPAPTPICRNSWGGTPTEEHLRAVREIVDLNFEFDCYWIDAGWYGQGTAPCPSVFDGDWGSTVGDWRVNPTRHPRGLKPIADELAKSGMKFLLWFETERAVKGTPPTDEHPEWYLRSSGGSSSEAGAGESLLFNLGKPEAREWLTQTIGDILESNNVSWYREDFNMVPNPYWEAADEEGRAGMTEMRFVEGLYQFWDDLRARIPNLMIDNCASGGRRIELETLKRSVALWRSDYNCFPYLTTEVTQSHTFGLAHWLPANATSPFLTKIDDYQCRSALSSGAVLTTDEFGEERANPEVVEWLKKRVAEAKRAQPYFYGDFYPLTQGNWSNDAWLAYEMLLPESGDALLVAFRREKSPVDAMTVELPKLDPQKKYRVEDVDSENIEILDGKDLIENGFTIKSTHSRESKLIYISPVK